MLASAHKLQKIGADFRRSARTTRCTRRFRCVAPRSPLPWLHIAEVVAAQATARGFQRAWAARHALAGAERSLSRAHYARPTPPSARRLNRIIMDELVCGIFKPEALAFHQRVISRMKDEGCDAVVLGCTEIPLLVDDSNSPLPTLDSTRLLARAALKKALQQD